jgi:hypothetical protein
MPSNPTPPRPLYTPGADFNQRTIPATRQPQRAWFRVHGSGSSAVQFGKLPHHRFSHASCPFPLLYVGSSIQTCLWEYFGDDVFRGQRVISAARWHARSLSRIVVPQLKVCAVSQEPTRDAMGVDKASLLATDLSIPQAWGLAVQQHPAAFDAIKYSSRFIDQPCLALFDRGGMVAHLQETLLGPLNSLDAALDWLDEHKAALV